jgi:outer membrane protein assembly factor BamD
MSRRSIVFACVLALAMAAPGCAKRKQRRQELSLLASGEETYAYAMKTLEEREFRHAKEYFQRVEFSVENRRELEPLVRLGIADLTYYQSDSLSLIEARALYQDFVTLYGDHPKAPYAQLQAGLCSLAQVNHPSRDQSQTEVAIADLRGVVDRYPNSPYVPIARLKIREAQSRLAEHDFLIGRFYIKKKAFHAGVERLRGVLNAYPDFDEKDKVYYWLGSTMVLADNEIEGRLYLEKLLADYPASEYAKKAREALAKAAVTPDGNEGSSS